MGELVAVTGNAPALALTLRTKHDGDIRVITGATTSFRGKDHKSAALAGLQGRRLTVHGSWNEGGELVASRIIVRPARGD